jgi:PAS domain-containing protein
MNTNIPDIGCGEGVALLGPVGLVVYANAALAALFGVPLDHLTDRPILDFIGPGERTEFARLLVRSQCEPHRREMKIGAVRVRADIEACDGLLLLVFTDLTDDLAPD